MARISPLAVVDPKATLAGDVEVGPFCVIGPDVELAEGCRLMNNVTLLGRVRMGRGNVLFPNVVIGTPPQDKKWRNERTCVEIGDNNTFREAVTIHMGTEKGGGVTRVGSNNFIMVNVHIGHDVQFGNNIIVANSTMFAGHVVVHDNANLAGGVGVHQAVTVGEYCFVGGLSRIHHDVPPYCKVDGADQVRGINVVGLKRGGFADNDVTALEDACRKLFYKRKTFAQAMAEFDTQNGINPHVKRLIEFLRRRDEGKHGRYLEGARR